LTAMKVRSSAREVASVLYEKNSQLLSMDDVAVFAAD
jgi:hypothetical protein